MGADSGIVSFRDPAGRLFQHDGRILRAVRPEAAAILEEFLGTELARAWTASGSLVPTRKLGAAPDLDAGQPDAAWYEHQRAPFASYPFEWPPQMLHSAARLTLEFARALLDAGWGLKDATPYNILFWGPKPVFVDLLSMERRDPQDPTWLPYAQFVRTFLLPLAVNRDLGTPVAHLLMGRRDGLEPEEVACWLNGAGRWKPPYLTLVTLPAMLGRSRKSRTPGIYQQRRTADPEKARFILSSLLGNLDRQLRRLEPGPAKQTAWSGYMSAHSYARQEFEAKESFVRQAILERAPKRVLDAGCNTGYFSELAARTGASVVALDLDETVAGSVWNKAVSSNLAILPLVINLSRPTPAMGWRNRETSSFLHRALGSFDLVLMLALIHHLLVTERIPLDEVLDLAADLTCDSAVIEYVDPADEMFQVLARGRGELHKLLTAQVFENACSRRFEILRSQPAREGLRRLYLLKKR
jgi:hypothetical protein